MQTNRPEPDCGCGNGKRCLTRLRRERAEAMAEARARCLRPDTRARILGQLMEMALATKGAGNG